MRRAMSWDGGQGLARVHVQCSVPLEVKQERGQIETVCLWGGFEAKPRK